MHTKIQLQTAFYKILQNSCYLNTPYTFCKSCGNSENIEHLPSALCSPVIDWPWKVWFNVFQAAAEGLLTPSGYQANWCNLINPPNSYQLANTITQMKSVTHLTNTEWLVRKRHWTSHWIKAVTNRCSPYLREVQSPVGENCEL